jgi:hypothetical protein
VAAEAQRAKGARGKPPKGAKPISTPDGVSLYRAPRDQDGTVSAQPAIGEGSVTADIFGRVGDKVARTGVTDAFSNATGLQEVVMKFQQETGEGTGEFKTVRRTLTIAIPKNATTRERELAIARATNDAARSLLEGRSKRKLLVSSVGTRSATRSSKPSRKLKRVDWFDRRTEKDVTRPRRKSAGDGEP